MILKESDRLLSSDTKIAYRLLEGRVFVFLAPKNNGKPLRQMYLGELFEGAVIPGMSEEMDYADERITFEFFIVPGEECSVEIIDNDKSYLDKMMKDMDYDSESEDWPKVLRDDYFEYRYGNQLKHEKKVSEHLEIEKQKREALVSTFKNGDAARNISAGEGVALYDVVSFLCGKMKINIASYDDIRQTCGEDYTVEDIARLSGFMVRKVDIPKEEFKRDIKPLLFYTKDTEKPVAVYRRMCGPLKIYEGGSFSERKLHKSETENLSDHAYSIIRPLNDDVVDGKAAFRFMLRETSVGDIIVSLITMFLITMVGLILGTINQSIYDYVIPSGDNNLLVELGGLLISCMVGSLLFTICRSISTFRLTSRIKYTLQAALYNRIFHMPETFYRNRESAELAYRVGTLASNYSNLFNFSMQIILQTVFAWFYYYKMHRYSSALSYAGVCMVIVSMILTVVLGRMFQVFQSKKTATAGKIKSYLYQVIKGIEVIRTMGAEDEVLNEYIQKLSEYGSLDYRYAKLQNMATVATSVCSAAATIIIYVLMVNGRVGISIGTFMGFSSVYGCFSASMITVAQNALNIFSMLPMLKNSTEILKHPVEPANKGVIINDIKGDINIVDLSFSYSKDSENVLNDISLHISPGEYVAIVGASGCGKSTLLRLLLGFEKPTKGRIYYDSVNINHMNLPEFRRKIGVVIQDGGIFNGSILKNIKLNKFTVSEEDVMHAAQKVGLKADIDRMPMGLNTHISEQAQNISGGQKQRILIARALVGNPKILFLDEATSSLDNETQEIVKQSIDEMNITRVVIAHRLTTIKKCDRILVLNNGRIAEEGTYDELIEHGGLFKELVEKQFV